MINRLYYAMTLILILAMTNGCRIPRPTIEPVNAPYPGLQASIPWGPGATDSTQTSTTGPAMRADQLDAEINRLRAHQQTAEVQAEPLRLESVNNEIRHLTRKRDALLAESERNQQGEFVADEETPQGRIEPPPAPGFWRGMGNGILAAGQFIKDGFFDYSTKTEGAKSAAGTGLLSYGLVWFGNQREWWQVNEVAGAVHNTDATNRAQLAEAATALANADATTASVDGSGNQVSFQDLPQDTEIKLTVRGNNNRAEFDFQQDTQRETSISFVPATTTADSRE